MATPAVNKVLIESGIHLTMASIRQANVGLRKDRQRVDTLLDTLFIKDERSASIKTTFG